MARNERTTCKELIEPALTQAGWEWKEQLPMECSKLRAMRAVC